MSLVNQVLKDLEQRRSVSGDATGLRAAFMRSTRKLPRWVPWLVVAVLLGVSLFVADLMLREGKPAAAPTEMPVVTAPAVVEPVVEPVPSPPTLATMQRAVASIREDTLQLTLEFDGIVEMRHFTMESPKRLVVDLAGVDSASQRAVPVPRDATGLLGAEYTVAPDSAMRLTLLLADAAQASAALSAPDVVTIFVVMPPPVVEIPVLPAPTPAPRVVETRPEPVEQTPSIMERTLIASSPRQRAEAAYDQGVRALSEGRRAQAEARFRDALGHDSTLHAARLALANVLYQQGQLRESEAQLQQGLSIHPGEPALADRYARLLLERGDLGGAIGVLAGSPPPIETHPDHHAFMAALLQRAGNHAAAIETYSALVAVRPDQGLWWMGLGISHEAMDRPRPALEAYWQAARDPRLSQEVARFINERVHALSLTVGDN